MKKIILYILFFYNFFGSFAQQNLLKGIKIDSAKIEQKQFDKQALETYKKNADFNYNIQKKPKNIIDKIWDWLRRVTKKIISWMFNDIDPALGIIKDFLTVLPYLLLAVLLYFIIKFFLKVNKTNLIIQNTKINNVTLTEEKNLLNNNNLSTLINKAVLAKNYRLAIRYSYLQILQKLTKKELIVWQQEKTNADYIEELKTTKLHKEFIQTTYLYNFIWYGNFTINKVEFVKAQHLFNTLKEKINE